MMSGNRPQLPLVARCHSHTAPVIQVTPGNNTRTGTAVGIIGLNPDTPKLLPLLCNAVNSNLVTRVAYTEKS